MIELKDKILLAKSDNSFKVSKNSNLKEYGFHYYVDREENLIIVDYLTKNTVEIPVEETINLIQLLLDRVSNKYN